MWPCTWLAAGLTIVPLACGALQGSMKLTSNVPGTVFRVREAKIDEGPEEGWLELGQGNEVAGKVPAVRLEIAAKAPGFKEKRVPLTEPVPRYDFKFLDADREMAPPAPQVQTVKASPPAAAAPAVPPFTEQRHALIVGISTYRNADFQHLQNARRDAEALAQFLQSPAGGNISSERIHLLLDEEATNAQIIGALMRMAREADAGDLIILYFAGHARVQGSEKGARYLMPFDAVPDNPWGTALDEERLVGMLDQAIPVRQLLMLDCCYAGGPTVRGEVENVWGSLSGKGRVILTSTKGNETALDGDPRSRTGPFMSEVLSALSGRLPADKNGDKRLTVQELYDAIGPLVRKAANDAGHVMTPQLYGQWADQLELLRVH